MRWLIVPAMLSLAGCGPLSGTDCGGLEPVEERLRVASESMDPKTDPSSRVFASLKNAENCATITARRWARSNDTATVIVEAVKANCEQAIIRLAAAQAEADQVNGNTSALHDQTTGEEMNYNRWAFEKIGRVAMYRTVEARAQKCRAPR